MVLVSASIDSPLAVAVGAVGLPAAIAARLQVGSERGTPAPRLPVEEVGVACVGTALLAAARLHEARTGAWLAPSLDRGQVRAALVSERLFKVDGEPAGAGFAPASRFWRAADGWVRTHANYSWHHGALLEGVGAADDGALVATIAALPAEKIEAAVFAAGGVAAAVRTVGEWRSHPQGGSVAAEPLVDRVPIDDSVPGRDRRRETESRPEPPARRLRRDLCANTPPDQQRKPGGGAPGPASGFRVLDFTRVIAGPVCARYLGALGADVLRIDPPNLPDLEPGAVADTLLGKRSAFLDLGTGEGARRLDSLLDTADVVLLGHRPGALARFGLAPKELFARHPGLVVMELAAWGHTGPWRERRGFDSIVQAASGIAALEAGPDGEPGALPCQLLDHGTGYLAAAAVLAALAERWERGGSHLRRLSLARTARWLLEMGTSGPDGAAPDPDGGTSRSADAPRPGWHEGAAAESAVVDDDPRVTAVPPPGTLGATALRWRGPAARYGDADPAWLADAGA
jgi:hypothetical protein